MSHQQDPSPNPPSSNVSPASTSSPPGTFSVLNWIHSSPLLGQPPEHPPHALPQQQPPLDFSPHPPAQALNRPQLAHPSVPVAHTGTHLLPPPAVVSAESRQVPSVQGSPASKAPGAGQAAKKMSLGQEGKERGGERGGRKEAPTQVKEEAAMYEAEKADSSQQQERLGQSFPPDPPAKRQKMLTRSQGSSQSHDVAAAGARSGGGQGPGSGEGSGRKEGGGKVQTARGLRDRRIRLTASVAVAFYDVQDRLGVNNPSAALDWLMQNAADAIARLPPYVDTGQPRPSTVAAAVAQAPIGTGPPMAGFGISSGMAPGAIPPHQLAHFPATVLSPVGLPVEMGGYQLVEGTRARLAGRPAVGADVAAEAGGRGGPVGGVWAEAARGAAAAGEPGLERLPRGAGAGAAGEAPAPSHVGERVVTVPPGVHAGLEGGLPSPGIPLPGAPLGGAFPWDTEYALMAPGREMEALAARQFAGSPPVPSPRGLLGAYEPAMAGGLPGLLPWEQAGGRAGAGVGGAAGMQAARGRLALGEGGAGAAVQARRAGEGGEAVGRLPAGGYAAEGGTEDEELREKRRTVKGTAEGGGQREGVAEAAVPMGAAGQMGAPPLLEPAGGWQLGQAVAPPQGVAAQGSAYWPYSRLARPMGPYPGYAWAQPGVTYPPPTWPGVTMESPFGQEFGGMFGPAYRRSFNGQQGRRTGDYAAIQPRPHTLPKDPGQEEEGQ